MPSLEEKRDSLAMSDWPPADGLPLRRLSVGQALRDAVRAAPDVTALVEGTPDPAARRHWTYGELLADAERTAAALLGRFARGERVAIWANNLPEWVLLEYGAALAGITIVTVNPALRGGELRHVLANSAAQGLFMLPGYRGTDMRATLAAIRDELPQLREVVLLTEWDEFLASGRPGIDLSGVGPDDPAQIQYTSGTTGAPKGAVLRHAGITDNAALYAQRAGLLPGDVTVNPMPLFHTAGCVMSVLGTLSVHGTLVLPPAFDPAQQLRLLEEERGTSMIGVPTMLIAMLDAAEFRSADLSSLRCVVSGGAVVPAELVRRVERETPALVSIVFAQTESSPVITQTSPHDSADDRAETLGRPLPHTAVRIVNPRTGQMLPIGETGELLTRGYGVMLGYHDDPAATAAAIDSDGWLHTGDLALMDERGYFHIDGRLKEMIIRRSRYERKASVTDEISPGCMESVECESWADYLLAGSRELGTRALLTGGGVALEVSGDPSGSVNRIMGIGWDEPVSEGLLERIIAFYREAGASSTILVVAPQVLPPDWPALSERFGIAGTGSAIVKLSGEARAGAGQSKAAHHLDRGLRVGSVPASRADEWGRAMRLGFGDADPRRAQQSAGLSGLPGWRFVRGVRG